MDVVTVLQKLVAAAGTALSTPPRAMQMLDYVPDHVETPAIYPNEVATSFDETYGRGTDKLTVTLRLLCARTDDREGQHMLYGYLAGSGPSSVKAAIEAARGVPGVGALDDTCDDLRVESVSPARWFEVAGERLVGADFTVVIYGPGA